MRSLPPEPSPGDKIKADLIRDLIRAIRERTLIKGPNYALVSGPNGTVIKLDPARPQNPEGTPLPFEIRWDGSLNHTRGNWKIFLPDVESLCLVKEDYVEITGVSAIKDADGNDTFWHTVGALAGNGPEDVWLVVTVPDEGSTSTITAELLSDEGQASTGEKVYNVHIAALEVVPASSSTPAEHNVRQYVDSAVIISAASDEVTPDDKSIEKVPEAEEGETPDGDEGQLQIKGWKDADPSESNSVGKIIAGNGGTDEEDEQLICRKSDGTLAYRPIGKITDGHGSASTSTVSFVADVRYDTNYHQIQQRIDTLNLSTWEVTTGQYEMITGGQAVAHSTVAS